MIKKLFIELNEITYEFCKEYDDNFYFITELFKTKSIFGFKLFTRSEGCQEGKDLDPWVEWVTIHSGKPYSMHKIESLGAGNNCKYKMVWDFWEEESYSYSIWNVFNAYLKKSFNCKTYLPDPWANSLPKPQLLKILLAPTSLLAKKYSGMKGFTKLFFSMISALMFLPVIIFKSNTLLKMVFKYGFKNFSFSDCYIVYEYLLATTGLYLNKLLYTDNIIIGSNLIAHAQHHYWNKKNKRDTCYRSLYLADDLLKMAYKNFRSKYKIFILNAISQICITNLNEFDYLPLKGHEQLFRDLEINYLNISPNMSNDGAITFSSEIQMNNAFLKLERLKVSNKKLFTLNIRNNLTLEYYLSFRSKVDEKSIIEGLKKRTLFKDVFVNNGQRTGSHSPDGFIVVPSNSDIRNVNQLISNDKLINIFKT